MRSSPAARKRAGAKPAPISGRRCLISNWPFLPLIGAAFSIAIGGEIKSVGKSQTVGMLGAVLVATVAWVITVWLAYKVFGFEFLGTAVFNVLYRQWRPDHADRPVDRAAHRYSHQIAADHGDHLARAWRCGCGCGFRRCIRSASAPSSLGRSTSVAPAPLATISEKYHTPIVAITATTVVNLIFMALFVFTPWFSKIVILIEAAVLAWSVVLGAGMFFPYLRPQLYEKSPIAGKTVFGLPIMTVGCFFGFIAAQFYFWTLFFDPNAAGHDPTQVMIVAGVFVIGFAFYYVMKMIRRSQGIDVTLAFKEIPIE